MNSKNQANQIKPKSNKQKASSEPKIYKIIFKSGGTTVILRKNLTSVNADYAINHLKQIYNDWCGKFIKIQWKKYLR